MSDAKYKGTASAIDIADVQAVCLVIRTCSKKRSAVLANTRRVSKCRDGCGGRDLS